MDIALLALVALNALLGLALLVLVLMRLRSGGASSAIRQELQGQRVELTQTLVGAQQQTDTRLQDLRTTLEQRFDVLRHENEQKLEQMRQAVDDKLQRTLKAGLDENAQRIQLLTEANTERQSEMRKTLSEELEKLRTGNEAKLEKMRETVDEKLQGTLEKRLGESFALVSDRLEQVQKGLGEMQSLASDVGGLKRVLTNVKSRGGWGEVQLARQLEDVLTADQYGENVAVTPGSAERVEFAVKLPGAGEGEAPVWLPIDSKFPQEDYERLLAAQEAGDAAATEAAGRDVERAILGQAKLIASKYIDPPHTTDFAIMYLPTEGLFAEVMRRGGLVSKLQNDHRVTVAGPTTLMAMLNSLQMGFRTLAIEKRSSEVWKVLAAAKGEFQKYGQVWEKLGRQLATAQKTVSEAGQRTRAVERKLRGVESLELTGSAQDLFDDALPELAGFDAGDDPDAEIEETEA